MQEERKAWQDVWAAGQGVGQIDDIPNAQDLIERLKEEYATAIKEFK